MKRKHTFLNNAFIITSFVLLFVILPFQTDSVYIYYYVVRFLIYTDNGGFVM